MKIAYLSVFDPLKITSWSGCSYFLAKSFVEDHGVSLDYVGPLALKNSIRFRLKNHFYHLFGKNYLPTVEPKALREFARQASAAIDKSSVDFVLSLDAPPIAYLETKRPIVYFWDCTFLGNLEYPWFKNLAAESIRHGHDMEQRALDKCRYAVFSSDWAGRTAIEGYHVDEAKLKIAPLGANLVCTRTINDVRQLIDARPTDKCRLLFIGIDWIRKGGDVAYNVAKELNARGLDTQLTIVGCQPQISEPLPSFVKSLGFINKFEGENYKILEKHLGEAHFLLVPSIAESFGTVFCEASSFGTPSLARSIGGIPSAVRNDSNGRLFAKDAPISEYCDYILNCFEDYSKYKLLAVSSFNEFQARLSWKSTSRLILDLFRQI